MEQLLLSLLTFTALKIALALMLLIQEIKKILPEKLKTYLPLFSYTLGLIIGITILKDWLQGLVIGVIASASFDLIKELLQAISSKKQ